jgi:hypothetical protein
VCVFVFVCVREREREGGRERYIYIYICKQYSQQREDLCLALKKKNEKRELKQSLYYLVAASSSLSRLSCEKTLHANHGVCVRACVRACVRV